MKKYFKNITYSIAGLILLWGTSSYALELLYEKQGKAYYKTKDGKTIEHKINPNATKPTFLYRSADKRMTYFRMPDGDILVGMRMGAGETLFPVPEYDWRNGCSPTSAGMMMGYYDLNGYDGLYYQKLIPRGPAELSTFVPSSQRANKSIASTQHISDYYTREGNSGDDPCDGDLTTCHGGGNCLADFMGTSQDMNWLDPPCDGSPVNEPEPPINSDGGTTFYYLDSGETVTSSDIFSAGICFWETSGMYGIGEYMQYRGYSFDSLYNRYIDEQASGTGFTYANFKNEIDNNRPVLIHINTDGVGGHTMLAYGYSDPSTVYVRDTWTAGVHTMTWNGTYGPPYAPAMQHKAMTCFTPSGGSATPDDIIPNVAPLLIILLGT